MIIAVYFLFFSFLAWKNFRLALGFFVISLPAYLIRFSIGQFPSTLLEISFAALFLVWLIKYSRTDWAQIKDFLSAHKIFIALMAIFFIASIISVFVSGWNSNAPTVGMIKAAGIWRAYFLEPMLLFFIIQGRKNVVSPRYLILALAISTISIGVYAIIQEFTGWGIMVKQWANPATRRITSFFSSPNAVGLYMGPIIFLILANLFKDKLEKILILKYYNIIILAIILAVIFFTKSQGAWIAVGAGLLIFLFLIGHKKMAGIIAVFGVIAALIIPSVKTAVLFQDKASKNRLVLWGYTWNYLSASPTNFIFGTGLSQFFNKIQQPRYNPLQIEPLIYPHNIFLNFWTETGILGALSFAGIMAYAAYIAKRLGGRDKILSACLVASLVVIVVHGLVDVPYFKNDLAMMFWIIVSTIFLA